MFFERLFHWFLLRLPPETSHGIVIRALRLWQCLWARKPSLSRPAVHTVSGTRLAFPGRVGMAAGFDKNAEVFAALAGMGFGFIEVGTVTPLPQPGNPKPRIWRHGGNSLVNSLGFNNCGLEAFRRHIARYRERVGVPLLANIGKGKTTPNESALDDYQKGFAALADRVDGFVVNLSSPNTPGLRSLQSARFLENLARAVPEGKPTFVKLAPDLEDPELEELCRQIGAEKRFAGVVLTNTSRGLAEKLARAPVGGLSGRPLHERALECVTRGRAALGPGKTLIGVGGVFDMEGARRMRQAGADLVEIYTGFIYRGPALVRELRGLA
jgi:dihydroorotate dehydrogenase